MRREREEPGLGASFLQSCEWRIKLREPGMDRCPAEMQRFPGTCPNYIWPRFPLSQFFGFIEIPLG